MKFIVKDQEFYEHFIRDRPESKITVKVPAFDKYRDLLLKHTNIIIVIFDEKEIKNLFKMYGKQDRSKKRYVTPEDLNTYINDRQKKYRCRVVINTLEMKIYKEDLNYIIFFDDKKSKSLTSRITNIDSLKDYNEKRDNKRKIIDTFFLSNIKNILMNKYDLKIKEMNGSAFVGFNESGELFSKFFYDMLKQTLYKDFEKIGLQPIRYRNMYQISGKVKLIDLYQCMPSFTLKLKYKDISYKEIIDLHMPEINNILSKYHMSTFIEKEHLFVSFGEDDQLFKNEFEYLLQNSLYKDLQEIGIKPYTYIPDNFEGKFLPSSRMKLFDIYDCDIVSIDEGE